MAVTVRTTQTNTSDSSITSLVVTKPTGLAVGDLMIAWIQIASSGDIDTPSGWTVIGSQMNHATDRKAKAVKKIADSGDVAASNFTFTFSTSSRTSIGLMAFSNTNSTQDGTNQGTTADGSASSSGFTPTVEDLYLILVAAAGSGSENGIAVSNYAIATDNPSWTELFDANVGGGSNICCAAAYAERSAVTATGNATATATPNFQSIIGSALLIVAFQAITKVSPSVINATAAVNAPTITGGATVSPATINSIGEVKAPAHNDQADWSAVDKSDTASWSNQSKS